jgi:hypothetical protein
MDMQPYLSLPCLTLGTCLLQRMQHTLQVASLRQRAYVLRLYALTLLRCEVPAMLEPVLAALLLDPAAAAAAAQNGQGQQQQAQQNGLWSGVGSHNPLQPHSMPAALLALQQICSIVLQVSHATVPGETVIVLRLADFVFCSGDCACRERRALWQRCPWPTCCNL